MGGESGGGGVSEKAVAQGSDSIFTNGSSVAFSVSDFCPSRTSLQMRQGFFPSKVLVNASCKVVCCANRTNMPVHATDWSNAQ